MVSDTPEASTRTSLPQDILIVCSGNICRSPYAEGYLRHRLGRLAGVEIGASSAGTLGIVGSPPSPETLLLARDEGYDLASHRSQGITFDNIDEAEIILVMEAQHRRKVVDLYPESREKVHLLSEFHPSVTDFSQAPDIFDPIGLDMDEYRRCFSLVRDALDGFLDRSPLPR